MNFTSSSEQAGCPSQFRLGPQQGTTSPVYAAAVSHLTVVGRHRTGLPVIERLFAQAIGRGAGGLFIDIGMDPHMHLQLTNLMYDTGRGADFCCLTAGMEGLGEELTQALQANRCVYLALPLHRVMSITPEDFGRRVLGFLAPAMERRRETGVAGEPFLLSAYGLSTYCTPEFALALSTARAANITTAFLEARWQAVEEVAVPGYRDFLKSAGTQVFVEPYSSSSLAADVRALGQPEERLLGLNRGEALVKTDSGVVLTQLRAPR